MAPIQALALDGGRYATPYGFVRALRRRTINALTTPAAVIDRLYRDIAATLKEPAIAERMARAGLEPIGDTPQAFDRYLRDEAAKWGKLVKSAGIRAE